MEGRSFEAKENRRNDDGRDRYSTKMDGPLSSSRNGRREGDRREGDRYRGIDRRGHDRDRNHRHNDRHDRNHDDRRDNHDHRNDRPRENHRNRRDKRDHNRRNHSRSRERQNDRDRHNEDRRGGDSDRRRDQDSRGPPHHTNQQRNHHQQQPPPSLDYPKHRKVTGPEYRIVEQPVDDKLGAALKNDPRDPKARITKKTTQKGRNTESFDPASTLVRPDLRIHVGSPNMDTFSKTLKHDDVVIVPELFGPEEDTNLYYKLVEEMTEIQNSQEQKAEWISWHEGAHLISKHPEQSATFQKVINRLCEYFDIRKESIGTRFNWYKDSNDWKPFHHDSAAFNPQRAKNQNITVGVSFGATRELAFIRAAPLPDGEKVRVYFPQTNNGVFSFGRDANILWKHGINALSEKEQTGGKGRISIILWGLARSVVEEEGSPPLLGADGSGPHAQRRNNNQRNNSNNRNKRR